MKNRILITISDIHGSKQYTVHEIIKKVILYVVLFITLLTAGTFIYIKLLNHKVHSLKAQTLSHKEEIKKLEESAKYYEEKNKLLSLENKELSDMIVSSSEKLSSVNDQLKEMEEMIGADPDLDLNTSFQARLEQERNETVAMLRTKEKNETFSVIQKALLINTIPNGKPLRRTHITSGFGYRKHPVTHRNSFHPAVDLQGKKGTPIFTPASGVVVYAKPKNAYGNFVLIEHSYGFKTAYGHLSRFAVESGDYVNKGDIIGYVGNTGRSTGSHLHYEVRYLDKWINPKAFLTLDLENINDLSDKISKVNWDGILKQTDNLINLSK